MRNSSKTLMTCIGVAMAASILTGCVRSDSALNEVNMNDIDIKFVSAASIANYTELNLALLDTTRSTDSAMKAFGVMMINDHTTAGSQLKSLSTGFGLTAPDTLDDAHLALRANLDTLSGRSFDSTYIKNMVLDHTAAVALFESEIQGGQQQDIRKFATATLPTLQMHLDKATALAANY